MVFISDLGMIILNEKTYLCSDVRGSGPDADDDVDDDAGQTAEDEQVNSLDSSIYFDARYREKESIFGK